MVLSAIFVDAYISKQIYAPSEDIVVNAVIENNGSETGDFKIRFGVNAPTPYSTPRRGLIPGQQSSLKASLAAPSIEGAFFVALTVEPYDLPVTDSRELPFSVVKKYAITFTSLPEGAEVIIT